MPILLFARSSKVFMSRKRLHKSRVPDLWRFPRLCFMVGLREGLSLASPVRLCGVPRLPSWESFDRMTSLSSAVEAEYLLDLLDEMSSRCTVTSSSTTHGIVCTSSSTLPRGDGTTSSSRLLPWASTSLPFAFITERVAKGEDSFGRGVRGVALRPIGPPKISSSPSSFSPWLSSVALTASRLASHTSTRFSVAFDVTTAVIMSRLLAKPCRREAAPVNSSMVIPSEFPSSASIHS
mmetsp:Transcript_8350/g.21262  ORF Transcript_8350/g.21262 Transcript_8350/m.21262 type:complete len:236 (-) Transcript_8350:1315-2022(-)